MSLLVIGVSHRSAELSLLERVALDAEAAQAVSARARAGSSAKRSATSLPPRVRRLRTLQTEIFPSGFSQPFWIQSPSVSGGCGALVRVGRRTRNSGSAARASSSSSPGTTLLAPVPPAGRRLTAPSLTVG